MLGGYCTFQERVVVMMARALTVPTRPCDTLVLPCSMGHQQAVYLKAGVLVLSATLKLTEPKT
jgi:hypothetical protein